MDSTPPKSLLNLSQKHQCSIQKANLLDQKVQTFFQNNFKNPSFVDTQQMQKSTSSLANTKAFFQSEISLLLKMFEQTNKLYQQKETENADLKQKISMFEQKLQYLQKQNQRKQAPTQYKTQNIREENDEKKTRKKMESQEINPFKNISSSISRFDQQIGRHKNAGSLGIRQQQYWQIQKQNISLRQKRKGYQATIKNLNNRLDELRKQNFEQSKKIGSLELQIYKLNSSQDILKSRHQHLQKQYNSLQQQHGKKRAEYQIKIQNLKTLLKGIQQNNSPKKLHEKYSEGYFSINRILNKNPSQQSLNSSSSNLSNLVAMSYAQANLKQENQYLRTQLIKILDDKGQILAKLKKYKKIVQKYQESKKQQEDKDKSIDSQNQNNLNSANVNPAKSNDKNSAQNFKKNKNTSVLMVQTTEKKQKQIIEDQKIKNLFKQIFTLIFQITGQNNPLSNNKISFISQNLQIILKALNNFSVRKLALQNNLKEITNQCELLKKQKTQKQAKDKLDAFQFKSFLKQISQKNESQVPQCDSTDKTFKDIKILQKQVDKQKLFEKKEKQYLTKIQEQQKEISFSKIRISSLEQMNKELYKFKSQVESEAHLKTEQNKNNDLVPINSIQSNFSSHHMLQLSSFEHFKQKLTQFYHHTIKELQEWECSALKNNFLPSPNKKISALQNQIIQNSSFQIPQIIQKNILRISQQLKSIKDGSLDQYYIQDDKGLQSSFFKDHQLSKSFISQEKQNNPQQQKFQDLLNKRLLDFKEFSSNYIQNLIQNERKMLEKNNEKLQKHDETIKIISSKSPQWKYLNLSKTQRSMNQKRNPFEISMNEIDALSESMTSSQMHRQRQIFIRQEVSFYIQKHDHLNKTLGASRKSYQSFRI